MNSEQVMALLNSLTEEERKEVIQNFMKKQNKNEDDFEIIENEKENKNEEKENKNEKIENENKND